MLKTRVISGIILIIFMLLITILGGNTFSFTMATLSLGGLYELYHCAKLEKTTLAICGYAMTVAFWTINLTISDKYNFLMSILTMTMLSVVYVIQFRIYKLDEVVLIFFGYDYLIGMFYFLQKVRISENGIGLMLLLIIGTWGCDTCAYFTGRLLGKRKLASVLSPKKTVEGAVGGVVGAVLLGIICSYVFPRLIVSNIPSSIFCVMVCFTISIVSQFGDLTASAIKRNFAVKDYGKLIPGHGGILDRFDSLMFSAPIMYLIALVFA
ncbi:MAG: phosphatidate cytidylyltransferase [Lachnospiraceae bacterium]|nr:phosphatidate cytidylyltransferase [Lachnospiraceae bacterium]